MAGLRADNVAIYTKDMYKAAFETFSEVPVKYPMIYKVVTGVNGSGDKKTQLLGLGDLTRHTAENQAIDFRSPVQGWPTLVRYWMYSDGLALSKESVDDNVKLGNFLKDLAGTWGESVRDNKETFAARAFNEGGNLAGDWIFNGTHIGNTDSSGDLMYDSEPLFNLAGNTRTTKGGQTYYNSVVSLTVTPGNFETLYNLQTSTNNRNELGRVKANPADTILVRPGADRFAAERIADTGGQNRAMPGGQLNDMNPYYKIVSVIDWDYLESGEAAFFVGKRQHKAFQFHERQKPEIRFFRDETNVGYKASITIRQGLWFQDGSWQAWCRGGGTSA